jgi:hypothetical protein
MPRSPSGARGEGGGSPTAPLLPGGGPAARSDLLSSAGGSPRSPRVRRGSLNDTEQGPPLCSKQGCSTPCCCGRSGIQWIIWTISGPLTSIPGFVIGGFFFDDCPAIPQLTSFLLAFAGYKAVVETSKLLFNIRPPIEKFCRKRTTDASIDGQAADPAPGAPVGAAEIIGNGLTFGLFGISIWGCTLTLSELERFGNDGGEDCSNAVFVMGFLSSFIPCTILALMLFFGGVFWWSSLFWWSANH